MANQRRSRNSLAPAPPPQRDVHAKAHTARTILIISSSSYLRRTGGPYLLGPDFSAADILYVHCCSGAENLGWGKA